MVMGFSYGYLIFVLRNKTSTPVIDEIRRHRESKKILPEPVDRIWIGMDPGFQGKELNKPLLKNKDEEFLKNYSKVSKHRESQKKRTQASG